MTGRIGGRTWAARLLAATITLAPVGGAWTEDPIAAGTTDVDLGGAISVSHGTGHDHDTVTGLQLLPHVGYVVSDAMGPRWLRGNLEVLIEPTLLYLKEEAESATIGGASGLVRWIFSGSRRLRPTSRPAPACWSGRRISARRTAL